VLGGDAGPIINKGRRHDQEYLSFPLGTRIATYRLSNIIEGVMTEPKKSVRIIMFIGLIALNIILLTVMLQRTRPNPLPQPKVVSPTAPLVSLEHHLFLPLTATAHKGSILLLPGDGVYYERDQGMQIVHVLGEVLNNTPTTVSKVMVEAMLNLKSGGQTSLRGYPLAGSIAPGDRACFDLYVIESKQVESYAVKVLSYATGGSVPVGLVPVVSDSGYDSQNGWFSVEGTLTSSEPILLNDLRAVVTLFDDSGRVLGCEQSYIRTQSEEANTPAPFSILFMNRDFSQGSNFSLDIAGTGE
jgi:hypothetical protein